MAIEKIILPQHVELPTSLIQDGEPYAVWINCDGEPAFELKFTMDESYIGSGVRISIEPLHMDGTTPRDDEKVTTVAR